MDIRVGNGYDAHRLTAGRKLFLGGVEIPYEKGLMGHSDADVLIHSICDAILGALNRGDIGRLFPDNDPSFKDVRSTTFLDNVAGMLEGENFRILSIDNTVIAQEPKIAPFVDKMRRVLSKHLKVDEDTVSIKATTQEGMGFAGRKEGIACLSTVLISKKD